MQLSAGFQPFRKPIFTREGRDFICWPMHDSVWSGNTGAHPVTASDESLNRLKMSRVAIVMAGVTKG
jgi:hypothetical protein